ncbi:MAG: hypothetical protein ABIZ70_14695 [Gemmatimonadales bacterium]
MTRPNLSPCARFLVLAFLAACAHTEPPTIADVDQQGPFSTAVRARITFNSDADLTPSWTPDGKGIFYTFGDKSRADHDRCLAMLPAEGGTRIWTLCDNRPGHADSAEMIASPALSSDGQLLYLVGASRLTDLLPQRVTLFLADTASPLNRRALLTLPSDVGGGLRPNWLTDINWTGPGEFIAMGGNLTVVPGCTGCALTDTVVQPLGVVRGTISGASATMELISGTEGVSSYSLADNGANIVIARGLTLIKMPRAGGVETVLSTLAPGVDKRIDDVSCRGAACVIGTYEFVIPPPPGSAKGIYSLLRVSTAGGAPTTLESTDVGPWSAVRASPTNSDVVLRIGPLKSGDLYLYRNLLP